jgi:tetratricopeptide (TPR) repeat protein
MNAAGWSRLEDLFHRAVALPPPARSAFLDAECASDAELRAEVESLLGHDAPPGSAIQDVVGQEAEVLERENTDWLIGRRIGAYRVTGIAGQGGMGAVYRAVRDDDQYRKEVAIKIVRLGSETKAFLERFRAERQILASLDHPYIARLLDGGATTDGLPYFVMELIEGVPITRYANDRTLSLEARLRLFQKVCEAVQYAHAKLIVHRDLKPANIFISADGMPKLLDFGMAKVLAPDRSEADTQTGTLRLLTPDYASPEQVRGDPITTATDIYSLGAVLYELLTGRPPHQIAGRTTVEIEYAVCFTEPLPPSRSAEPAITPSHRLAGDLDNIVLMALRKEPERRYRSVEQFSEDISRHLNGRPVAARADTFPYRAGKFVRRHRLALVAAAAVLIALAIGLVAARVEARRAERRFQQVRKLANSFVFDVHDRIKHLAGATEARKAIVATALEYLENLSQEAGGDASLVLELATAYERIGDVQGLLDEGNLGDTQGALASYRRAEAMLKALRDARDWRVRFRMASVLWKLGTVQQVRGQAGRAHDSYSRAREVIRGLVDERPQDPEALRLALGIHSHIGNFAISTRDTQRVEQAAAEQQEAARRLVTLDPSSRESRAYLTAAQTSLATAYVSKGQIEAAAQAHREAVAMREQLVREEPENVTYRRELMMSYGRLADLLGSRMGENLGDFAGAAQALQQATEIADWLVQHDSADRNARYDLASVRMRAGLLLLRELGQPDRAAALLEQAQALLATLEKEDPGNQLYRYNFLVLDYGIGQALAELGRNQGAAQRLERARREAASLEGGYYAAAARAAKTQATLVLAKLKARAGDPGAAVLADSVAADIAGSARMFAVRWNEASACADLGRVYLLLANREAAVLWLERSAQTWSDLRIPAAMEARRRKELAGVRTDLESARRLRAAVIR